MYKRQEYARFRELEGRFIDGTITQEEQTELRSLLEEGHGPGRAEEQQTLRLSDFVRHDELYQNYPQLRREMCIRDRVQVVRNRASTLSSAAPSWAQPKGRVASPSLPTASGTKGTQTDESRADAIREALVRLDAIEQTRAAAPRLTAEGLEREALEEIGREFGLDSQQTRTAYTARKALEEDLDRITNPRRKAGRAENGGKIEGAYSFGKSVEGAVEMCIRDRCSPSWSPPAGRATAGTMWQTACWSGRDGPSRS